MTLKAIPDPVFLLMLLGHVLGDFYLQTDGMVRRKDGSRKYLLLHGLGYSACMAAVLLIGVPVSLGLALLMLCASAAHLAVDWSKRHCPEKTWARRHRFTLDQCAHLALLLMLWLIWGRGLMPRWFVGVELTNLPAMPLPLLLGVLCILKPTGLLIEKGEIWNLSKREPTPEALKAEHSGRMIGYLERLIVLFFLLYHQYGAIAFVLSAKSVARFKEIETNQIKAEYYLIGTLLSMTFVFGIAMLLGLSGAAPGA